MGLLSSMYTGISGMQATGEALGVISDNIANANSFGFKTSRAEFQDVIAKSLKGVLGGNQIGRGTKLGAVNSIFSQGALNNTDRSTDLAIQGDGFFTLEGTEGRSYTRDGSFSFDKDGILANKDGYKVLGFKAEDNGNISSKMEPIKLGKPAIEAKKSDKLTMNINLDSRSKVAELPFDPKSPNETSDFSTGVVLYDSIGNAHLTMMYFKKTGDNTWNFHAMNKGEEVVGGVKDTLSEQATGVIQFTNDGKLQQVTESKNGFNFVGASPNQTVKFDFGDAIASGGKGTAGSSQFGAPSDVYKYTQDGYTAGVIAGYSFNDDGVLTAIYTNGESKNLAQLVVGKFENNEGLYKLGNNRFRETRKSGAAFIGAPDTAGRGKVFAKTLESSTTDMASEFINLMQNQRTFQANAKTLTVADELMQDVLNIKR